MAQPPPGRSRLDSMLQMFDSHKEVVLGLLDTLVGERFRPDVRAKIKYSWPYSR